MSPSARQDAIFSRAVRIAPAPAIVWLTLNNCTLEKSLGRNNLDTGKCSFVCGVVCGMSLYVLCVKWYKRIINWKTKALRVLNPEYRAIYLAELIIRGQANGAATFLPEFILAPISTKVIA